MSVNPTSSASDLGVFFEDWHHEVARIACEFASKWTHDAEDDRVATQKGARALAAAGLTRYCVPESYGGAAVGHRNGLDTRCLTLIREALGWADGSLDTAFAMQGLGSYPITLAGTDAQRSAYLPGIISGERLGAFALTEPNAGSDVASMECHAEDSGAHWRLNGAKTYISNAGIAGQYVVFAKTAPSAGRKASVRSSSNRAILDSRLSR